MNKKLVDPNKLYTKKEYSMAYDISRPTINKRIKNKEIDFIQIKGATLIIAA